MKIIKLIILSTLAIATMNCSDEPSHKLPDSPSPVKSKLYPIMVFGIYPVLPKTLLQLIDLHLKTLGLPVRKLIFNKHLMVNLPFIIILKLMANK